MSKYDDLKYDDLKAVVLKRFEGRDCNLNYNLNVTPVWAWHVHHNRLSEPLTEPVASRVDWIINNKAENEIATRLEWLRPVESKLPQELVKARAAYDKARVAWYKARGPAYDKAWNAYCKASDAWSEARAAYSKELEAIHSRELPGCPWDGTQMVFPAAEAAGG